MLRLGKNESSIDPLPIGFLALAQFTQYSVGLYVFEILFILYDFLAGVRD